MKIKNGSLLDTILIILIVVSAFTLAVWEVSAVETIDKNRSKRNSSLKNKSGKKTVLYGPEDKNETESEDTSIKKKIKSNTGYTSLSFNYGYGYRLKGYSNPLLVDNDKSQYLKAINHTVNIEVVNAFPTDSQILKDIAGDDSLLLVGFQLLGYFTPSSDSVNIPRALPVNDGEINHNLQSENSGGFGFFFGTDHGSFELDLGASLYFKFLNEKSREKYQTDGQGNVKKDANGKFLTESAPGRGLLFDKVNVYPNLRLRFGSKKDLNLVFDIFREQFNQFTDFINYSINIPVTRYFSVAAGNGFAPTMTLFIKPTFHMGNFNLHLKTGAIVDAYDGNISKISLKDSQYYNVGAQFTF